MANTIDYGIKFNTQDMERLIKLAEKLDKQEKIVVKDYQTGERKKTDAFDSELKKREQQLKRSKAWEKQLRNIDLANEKKMQAEITRNQKEEQRKRIQIAKQVQNGKLDMFAPVSMAKRVGGYIATSTAVYGGLSALRSGIGAIIEYDQALHNTYMAMGRVTEADKVMIKSITQNTEYTAKYGKSFVELAKSTEVLVKAGFKLHEVTLLLEPALALAAAGDMDLKDAAVALSQSLRNLGKPMGDAKELADSLAAGAAASAVDVKDMITSLEGVGAAGTTFGMKSKELIAWIGALSNVGLKGREAANAISRMWLRITKPQKEVVDLFADKNINLFDNAGRIRAFEDILNDIANASISLVDKQKLLGIHAFKTSEQILSAIPSYRGLALEMRNINEQSEIMTKEKQKGLQAKIDKMKSTWQDIFITQNGISGAIGSAVDKLTSLLEFLAANPTLVQTLAIAGATATAAVAGATVAGVYGAVTAAAAAGVGATYFVSGMGEEFGNYEENKKKRAEIEASAKSFAKWQSDIERDLANTKMYNLKQLFATQTELRAKEKIYLDRIKEFDRDIANKEREAGVAKWDMEYGKISLSEFYEITNRKKAEIAAVKKQQQALFEQMKPINVFLRLTQQEITRRKQPSAIPDDGTGNGAGNKQRIDDFRDFIERMQKLQSEADEVELTGWDKKHKDIINKYDGLQIDLQRRIDENKEKGIINVKNDIALQQLKIAKFKTLNNEYNKWVDSEVKRMQEERYKQLEKENKRNNELLDKHYEEISSTYESTVERYGSVKQRQQLLDEEYLKVYNAVKEEAALRSLSATETEELLTNLKEEHTKARIQIAYEGWQKEHQFANATMGAIGSAYDTLAQTMTDIDMNGKDRREAIWESFRSTAITAIMDVVKQLIVKNGLEMLFDDQSKQGKQEEAAAVNQVVAAKAVDLSLTTASGIGKEVETVARGANTAAVTAEGTAIAATLPAKAADSAFSSVSSWGLSAIAGLGAIAAVYGLIKSFSVDDAIVADGKVHPYRKDDLVMIGTGLGSKSGAQIPNKALPEGFSGNNSNAALIRELQGLRFAVASGNAAITKAVADNTPTFTGEVLSPVKVYKRTLIGKNQANFVVNNSK